MIELFQGEWSAEEDQNLTMLRAARPPFSWIEISRFIRRSADSCRHRERLIVRGIKGKAPFRREAMREAAPPAWTPLISDEEFVERVNALGGYPGGCWRDGEGHSWRATHDRLTRRAA